MRRLKIIVPLILVLLMLTACQSRGQTDLEEVELPDETTLTVEEEQAYSEQNSTNIYVYVCGCVANEGVYELPEGSRLYEAIQAAGGITAEGDGKSLNQAQILQDEDRIYVPGKGEESEEVSMADGKVSINRATKEELMTLPGVGEAKAEKIIEYRKKNGNFSRIEDIMQISGIKEGLFAQIKDLIKL